MANLRNTTLDELSLQCRTYLRNSIKYGTIGDLKTGFIRTEAIEAYATEWLVFQALCIDPSTRKLPMVEMGEYVEKILGNSKKIFVISLAENFPLSDLLDLVKLEINDESFSYPSAWVNLEQRLEHFKALCVHFREFILPPVINRGKYDQKISSRKNLDITTLGSIGAGQGVSVRTVRVGPGFFNDPVTQDDTNSPVLELAMKVSDTTISTQLAPEVAVLRTFTEANFADKHLVRSYAGFYCEQKHYLFSELGVKDLENFMESHSFGERGTDMSWILEQFLGLTKLLEKIHHFSATQVGFHHDIKPANIIIFGDDKPTLKLTDWGNTEITTMTAPGGSPRSTRRGDQGYLPPEMNNSPHGTSRPHDIWSLGCVFTLVLVWATAEDSSSFEKFTEALGHENKLDNFHMTGKLKQVVFGKIRGWKNDNPLLGHLGKLLEKMLHTNPNERLLIGTVVELLVTATTMKS